MTMAATVRAFRPDDPADAEAVARVRRAAYPQLVCTAQAVAWQAASAPPAQQLRWFVAETPGAGIAGCAEAGMILDSAEPGQGFLHTAVHPGALGRGTGSELVAAAERHLSGLGVGKVFTWVADDGRSPGFAVRRGYEQGRGARFLGLDLAGAVLPPLPDPLPPGVALRTAADFAADLRPLYEADVECAADEPSDVPPGDLPYEEWLLLNWRRPDFDARLTSVVVVDGEVAAYSVAQTDGRDRYWSAMTGTRRAFRGRGLAGLAKLDSLRRARAAGIRHAFTGNDASNAPMLAVNERLGYTPAGGDRRYSKLL